MYEDGTIEWGYSTDGTFSGATWDYNCYEREIEETPMENKYDFESVYLNYTGGGIYVAYGKMTDGRYFVASDDCYDVRFLDADPLRSAYPEFYGYDTDIPCGDIIEWQEAHVVADISNESDSLEFWDEMLAWVEQNKPDGNYALDDVSQDRALIADLRTRKNWR